MAITLIINHGEALSVTGGTTSGIDTSGSDFLVVALITYVDPSNNDILSDSKSNTWNSFSRYNTSSQEQIRLYYAINPTVGTGHTFTAGGGFTEYAAICIAGFSGMNTTSPYDTSTYDGNANDSASTLAPQNSITPSAGGERLVISGFGIGSTTSVSVDSGMSITDTVNFSGGNNYGASMAYKIQATGTAIQPTWTNSTTCPLVVAIAAFKAAPPAPQETRPIPSVSDLNIAHWTAHLSRARYYSEPIKRFEGHTPQPTYIFLFRFRAALR